MVKSGNLERLKTLLVGILAGIASLIPGFSAATVLLLAGRYKEFINSVSKNAEQAFKAVKSERSNLGGFVEDGRFLTLIFVGGLIGIFFFSSLIEFFFLTFPDLVFAFFSGVLVTTGIFLFKHISDKILRTLFLFLGGLTLGVVLYLGAELVIGYSSLVLFFLSGFAVALALMIPGMSGSAVLILFGQYQNLLSQLNQFLSFELFREGVSEFLPLIIFGTGLIAGFVSGSMVIKKIIDENKSDYLAFVSGILFSAGITSLFQILPGSTFSGHFLAKFSLILLGVIAVYMIEWRYGSLRGFSSNSVS